MGRARKKVIDVTAVSAGPDFEPIKVHDEDVVHLVGKLRPVIRRLWDATVMPQGTTFQTGPEGRHTWTMADTEGALVAPCMRAARLTAEYGAQLRMQAIVSAAIDRILERSACPASQRRAASIDIQKQILDHPSWAEFQRWIDGGGQESL